MADTWDCKTSSDELVGSCTEILLKHAFNRAAILLASSL
eukprot:CAMPEP_0194779640 /NCGR_PEP_ID=MMETSP0323_2-20130528/71590_1 /TAXON_ID=2866 ORGANISM="Crypthecodinium cohnii, Strain Seligo" /NCGR_SAMPLE_ID=MMETSP0323_2 /ASSEMBLY_ACC=CAM_ASM_000346 /LENGTH=38 /DNA_ID= /DNA_START= /DNA_END= /DNA_ORIENTATION=